MLKIYQYKNCNTCKKALNFLRDSSIPFESISIVDQPPSKDEILRMISYYNGNIKPLFNTSGQLYREMNIKSKIQEFTTDEAVELLASHGKLIKRPFAIDSEHGLLGFKESVWAEILTKN